MSNRSTTEQIQAIRNVTEKARVFHRKSFIAFVEFKAAFESVDREFLWPILQQTGLPEKCYRLFMVLYTDTKSSVQVSGCRSPQFKIDNCVWKGCAAIS